MADPQQIVEQIHIALVSSSEVAPEDLKKLAQDYTSLCTELIERMHHCIPSLRNGNFSEALRLVEAEPNLLELYSLLDFPEREDWIEITSTFDFPVPPPFPEELAQELNDAYVKHMPLDPLLKKFRRLALAGASVSIRLPVLRQLSILQPDNIRWSDDLLAYEKKRIEQLQTEVNDALKSKNIAVMQRLRNEIANTYWTTAPPDELLPPLEAQLGADFRKNTFQKMVALAKDLNDAHAQFDEDHGILLIQQLNQVAAQSRLNIPKEIQNSIEPARQWIKSVQADREHVLKFENSLNLLKNAINSQMPIDEIYKRYTGATWAAEQADREIPDAIEDAYNRLLCEHDLKQKRSTRLKIFTIVGVCMVFMAAIGGVLYWQYQEREANLLVERIEQCKQSQDLDAIRSLYQELTGEKADARSQHSNVVAGIAGLRAVLDADDNRAQQFQSALSRGENMLESRSVDNAVIPVIRDLAKTEDEKISFIDFERRYKDMINKERRELEETFQAELTQFQQEMKNYRERTFDDLNKKITEIERLHLLCEKLQEHPGIDQTSKNQCMKIAYELNSQKGEAASTLQNDQLFSQIIEDIGHWGRYQSKLSRLVSQTPSALTDDFQKVLENDDVVQTVFAMSELGKKYTEIQQKDFPSSMDCSVIARLTLEIRDRFHEDVAFPVGGNLLPYFQAAAKNVGLNSLQGLEDFLMDLTKKKLYPVTAKKDGKWYFLESDPAKVRINNTYVMGFTGSSKVFRLGESQITTFETTYYDYSLNLIKLMDSINDDNRTKAYLSFIRDLMKVDGIDPILKCILLKKMISEFGRTDYSFQKHFVSWEDVLEDKNFDMEINWINSDSKDTEDQRRLAGNRMIPRLSPSLDTLTQRVQDDHKQFLKEFKIKTPRIHWTGILSKRGDQWNYTAGQNIENDQYGDGTYYVFYEDSEEKIRWTRVGSRKSSQDSFNIFTTKSFNGVLQGQPVFLLEDVPK